MSRRFDQKDEKIIERLQQMPKVTDERSKKEIYIAVEEGLQRSIPVHEATSWKIPVMTTVAVLLLLLLFSPNIPSLWQNSALPEEEQESFHPSSEEVVFDDEDNSSEEDISSSSREDNALSDAEADDEDVDHVFTEATEQSTQSENVVNYISSLTEEDIESGDTYVTIPLLVKEEGHSFIIPITFKSRSDKSRIKLYEQYNKEYTGEEFGFHGSPLAHITWEERDGYVVASFEKDVSRLEKEESDAIVHGIEESLRFIDELEVQFTFNGEDGVQLAHYGRLENYPVSHNNRGYYLYSTDQHTFLVSGKGANLSVTNEDGEMYSLEETLERMKRGNEEIKIEAAIPEGVKIDSVQERGNTAYITFAEGTELPNAEHTRVMVEAMLFAAKDFGYEQIVFEGENIENLEEYALNEPLHVPVAPNKVD